MCIFAVRLGFERQLVWLWNFIFQALTWRTLTLRWLGQHCHVWLLRSSQASDPLTHWPLRDFNKYLIFKLNLVIDGWGISCEIALRWMDHTDYKSILFQVMTRCCQECTYLSKPLSLGFQCWSHIYIYIYTYIIHCSERYISISNPIEWILSFYLHNPTD